jgi:expansin (peptidoglycan-binding protein)
MAHRPGGNERVPRRPDGRRRWWPTTGRRRWLGLGLGAGTIVGAAALALAVGISQATTAPACAAAQVPAAALAPATARQAQVSGEATHYVLQAGAGNCSYPGPPASQLFVALSPGEYDSAAACGSYVQVTGPDGSVTAEVIDQCPPCQAGHVDLSEQAFARIAPLAAGLVPVTYHTVADPPLPGPLSLLVKDGSSAYWLALLPIGAGNPVTSVRVSSAARGGQELSRASYGYWLAPSGMGAGPFTVQLTDSEGHRATVTGVTLSPGVVQPTRTWMYGAAAPSASPRPTPAATVHRSTSGTPAASPPATAAPAIVPAATAAPATAAPAPSPSPC